MHSGSSKISRDRKCLVKIAYINSTLQHHPVSAFEIYTPKIVINFYVEAL